MAGAAGLSRVDIGQFAHAAADLEARGSRDAALVRDSEGGGGPRGRGGPAGR